MVRFPGSPVLTPNAVYMFILCIIRHVLPCILACAVLACLTLNITAAHSCTAASILSLLVLCPNWVGKLSYVDMPMRHASSNLCQIGI